MPTRFVPPAAASIPAGTVLADRYRLEELLADQQPTVTWRAFDQVLSRSVLVHLLPPLDPGAQDLLEAARSASAATDSRFLRVLDAVYSDDPQLGSYIVCEYATGQSLETVLASGPLSGLEAAWVVREVADALSGVHVLGLYHRRINPDTVIVTPTGNIKIVGLMIEAALKPDRASPVHGATTPEMVDVLDLGRLLYAALVARWPGGPAFGMPDAPVIGRRWMTPRQVRAGVSPALDLLCDQILGEPPRHRAPLLTSANDVVNALTTVLGAADASSDLERRLRQPVPRVGLSSAPVSSLLEGAPTRTSRPVDPPVRDEDPDDRTEQMAKADLPQPGPRRTPTPLPQPTSDAPASASAAADLGQTTLIRQPPPPPGRGSGRSGKGGQGRAGAVTQQRRRPRRWIGLLVALVVLLAVAGLVAALALRGRDPEPGNTTAPGSTAPSTSATPQSGQPIAIQDARDFDPQADPPSENPKLVDNAFDGKPKTRWQTVTYFRNPELGGLKRGVGLVVDLGTAHQVGSVKVALSGAGTAVDIRVPKSEPATTDKPPMGSDDRWRTVSREAKATKTTTFSLEEPVSTRFVLVYLTSLPKEGGGYKGGIFEIEVLS